MYFGSGPRARGPPQKEKKSEKSHLEAVSHLGAAHQ